jgi:cellulose synthase/poly-beta-1,6-N-acetylglucosamine synthase-like glycosyltransferase
MTLIREVLHVFAVFSLGYFAVVSAVYLLFTALASREIKRHRRRRAYAASEEAFASPLTPPVSVLLPAFNEQTGIVESVHSLLSLRYPEHEVVVVNDGSTDDTLAELQRAFDLVPVRKALRDAIRTAPVHATYVSRRHPELWVIDKENGGKADALNAGVNAARYPYVCAVDADAILEEDSLLRVAKPMLDDPELVVATGGIIRIANGCMIDHGDVVEVGLPRSRLATLQVVEYLRAFLVGRLGWSRLGSLLIISGAFGLFRRSVLETSGGWWTRTVGEDVELVVRLHRHLRERGEEYRIEFVPDPVCWTEVPEDLRSLSSQRRRWQRGLGEALWRHKTVALKPRYGALGLVAFPYFIVFELLGPVVQVIGFPIVIASAAVGAVSLAFLLAFFIVSVLLGVLLSVSALALEEFSFRRHQRGHEATRLLYFAVLENLGFRQLLDLWRVLAIADLAGGRGRHWGTMHRRGLGSRAGAEARATRPAA